MPWQLAQTQLHAALPTLLAVAMLSTLQHSLADIHLYKDEVRAETLP